ncbi:MAG: hypothetical protein WC908_01930 [Candidatus Paceibacterota bacterium]
MKNKSKLNKTFLMIITILLVIGVYYFLTEQKKDLYKSHIEITKSKVKKMDNPIYKLSFNVTKTKCFTSHQSGRSCDGPSPYVTSVWNDRSIPGVSEYFKLRKAFIEDDSSGDLISNLYTDKTGFSSIDVPPGKYSLSNYFENSNYRDEDCIRIYGLNTCNIEVVDSDVNVNINYHTENTE